MKRQVAIQEATHVRTNDLTERIVAKFGVGPGNRLAKPSEGGFGVYTESGRRVTMMQAHEYLADDDGPAPPVIAETDWHNMENRLRLVEDAIEEHRRQLQAHINEYLEQGEMDCDAGCPDAILVRKFAAQIRLAEAQWRMNHWPPFGVLVGSQDRHVVARAFSEWIGDRADEQRNRILEHQEAVKR